MKASAPVTRTKTLVGKISEANGKKWFTADGVAYEIKTSALGELWINPHRKVWVKLTTH